MKYSELKYVIGKNSDLRGGGDKLKQSNQEIELQMLQATIKQSMQESNSIQKDEEKKNIDAVEAAEAAEAAEVAEALKAVEDMEAAEAAEVAEALKAVEAMKAAEAANAADAAEADDAAQKSGSEITLEGLDNPKIINKFENITLEFPNYIPSNLQSKLMDIYLITYNKNEKYNEKYYIVSTLDNLKQTLKSTKQLTRFPIKLYPVKNIQYFFKHAESFHTTNTCGIENTGNSCYQNTFYQFLFSTQIIANFFLKSLELEITLDEEKKNSELYCKKITILHLANLIRIYWELENCGNNNKILEYAVKSIKEKFFNKIGGELGKRFATKNEEDSHEFFTYLFNTVINEGLGYIQYKDKKKKAKYPTVGPDINKIIQNNNEILKLSNISEFHKIISFLIIQTIECSNEMCKNQSFAIQGELENHIVLNICLLENDTTRQPYSYITENGDRQYYHPRKVTKYFKTIKECIENYKIDSNVEKKCDICSKHKNIPHTKKLKLYGAYWGPPPIFIIHLKRLINIKKHNIQVKKEESIMIGDDNSFILEKPFEVEESDINYELFAFINHEGGAKGGHYIYHTRDNKDNVWTIYNDSHPISNPTESEVIEKASKALVLFFRKCSSSIPSNVKNDEL